MNTVLPKEAIFNQAQIDEIKALIKAELEKSVDVKVWKYKEVEVDEETNETKVKLSYSKARLPVKKHASDTGFDVYVCFDDTTLAASESEGKKEPDSIILYPGKTLRIPTGVCVSIPEGYEIQCRPRSGCLAIPSINKNNYSLNVELTNVSNDPILIEHNSYSLYVYITKCVKTTCCFEEK